MDRLRGNLLHERESLLKRGGGVFRFVVTVIVVVTAAVSVERGGARAKIKIILQNEAATFLALLPLQSPFFCRSRSAK